MQLLDRQGNPVDIEIAIEVMWKEYDSINCENGMYWNCDKCACKDNPQRHT